MEADTIYLKTALQTSGIEYYTVVSEVLRKKAEEGRCIFDRKKSEKGRWQTLERKFQAGPISQDDAAAIMIELQSAMNTLSLSVPAGKTAENADAYAILRGAYMKITELIKEDMDKKTFVE